MYYSTEWRFVEDYSGVRRICLQAQISCFVEGGARSRPSRTASGAYRRRRKRYQQALPYWQSAQKHLKQVLGEPNWNKMVDAVVHTAEAVQ